MYRSLDSGNISRSSSASSLIKFLVLDDAPLRAHQPESLGSALSIGPVPMEVIANNDDSEDRMSNAASTNSVVSSVGSKKPDSDHPDGIVFAATQSVVPNNAETNVHW